MVEKEAEKFERIMQRCVEALGMSRDEIFHEWKRWDAEQLYGLFPKHQSLCIWAIRNACADREFCEEVMRDP